jgi:branched-chain amino acid aminotransferase
VALVHGSRTPRERGIKVRTSSFTRHHVNITMCKAKANGNYINSMLALREALESGAEEALLLDNEGYVAEGSGENVFIVRGGKMHTPELTSCLDGITRATIFALRESSDLRSSSAASPATRSTWPTRRSSREPPRRWCRFANLTDGPSAAAVADRSRSVQGMYFDAVRGRRAQNADWLTPVA